VAVLTRSLLDVPPAYPGYGIRMLKSLKEGFKKWLKLVTPLKKAEDNRIKKD